VRSLKRTTGSETWSVPWSTRAVILLAFAIQLMPVAERPGLPGPRSADRLVLSDGRVVALWLSEGAAKQAAAAPAALAAEQADEQCEGVAAPTEPGFLRPGFALLGCGLLPMPPPAIA